VQPDFWLDRWRTAQIGFHQAAADRHRVHLDEVVRHDLGDDHDRLAFQITSTTTLEKVKFTVQQFMDRAYYNTFDELFILMLGKKQSSHSQASVNELLTDQFAFNCKKHIIDLGDILGQVTALRLAAQERVLSEFKRILGEVDAYISFSSESIWSIFPVLSSKSHIRVCT